MDTRGAFFENDFWRGGKKKITHLKLQKKIKKKNSQSVACLQTANIRIYTPRQQQVMRKLFFDGFLSQSPSLISPPLLAPGWS